MSDIEVQKEESVKNLVHFGSSIAIGLSSVALGLLFDPAGALAGAIAAPLLTDIFKNVGADVKGRLLGPREEIRIGGAYIFALNKIQEKLTLGQDPRTDTFYENTGGNRSAAEEILEGVLLLAQKEHEELKVKHYGYLVANISFDSNINRGFANLLLRLADRISYRQLCLLQIFSDVNKYELFKTPEPSSFDLQFPRISSSSSLKIVISNRIDLEKREADLNLELLELEKMGLTYKDETKPAMLGVFGEHFVGISLTHVGKTLQTLPGLNELNAGDLEGIASSLRFVSIPS